MTYEDKENFNIRRIKSMGIEAYYLSKKMVSGIGSIFLLNELQEADGSGGGKALLGSVVQENKESFHVDYPVPLLVSEANIIVNKLKQWKTELNINSEIVVEQPVAAGNKSIKIEKDNSFQVGLGPFPNIPFNGKFQIDYKKTISIDIAFGAGTIYQYIRKGDLMKMYSKLNGKPDADMTGKFLEKNAFVSLIQLAKNWTVNFESSKSFDTDIEAKIKLFNADDVVKSVVKLSKKSETKIQAEVKGDAYYLVGLMSTRWSDIKPD